MRLYLQAPGDPSDTRVMWMQPEKKIPCLWLLARKMPGRVWMCTLALRQAGLTLCKTLGFTVRWDSISLLVRETPLALVLSERRLRE